MPASFFRAAFVLLFSLILAAPAAGRSASGVVFRDFDADGSQDALEPGVSNITVQIFDATGATVGSATTASDGTYSATLSVGAGTQVRLELSSLPGYLRPGPFGSDSGTTVVFLQAGDTDVDIGLANPAQYCQAANALGDLELATNCYIDGVQSSSSDDVLVSFDYLAGDTGPSGNVDLPAEVHLASADEIGPTWGLAYQRSSSSLFAATFMKRHVSFLSDGATGKIFRIDLSGGAVTEFLDLNTLFGAGTTGDDPHPAGTDLERDNNNDGANGDINEAWDAVGKRAFGDLEISDDELTLYVVNLVDRALYSIPLGTDPASPTAPTSSAQVTVTPIPDPCGNSADARPFGLGVKDGSVYVGGVCSAESSQNTDDLSAYIYTFTDTGGFAGTPILAFDIDHPRGCVVIDVNCTAADWNPWRPTFTFDTTDFNREIVQPQPMLTDIEFDGDDLILGFRDRFGDQTGYDQYSTDPTDGTLYRGDAAGSVLRACRVAGSLTLESNGSCGGVAGAGVGNGKGPGGGEFYVIDYPQHDKVALAGLAQVPGLADLPFTMYDPINDTGFFFDGGAGWNSHSDGASSRRYRIYSTDSSDPSTFAKGGGLGDEEALCDPAPIEIGNRVWDDVVINGVQDPGEPALVDVDVTLVCASAGINVTTQTDANGQYLFNGGNVSGGVPPASSCEIRIDLTDPDLGGRTPTVANGGSNDLHDSDGILSGGLVVASLTTGAAGSNDHTYDFGFVLGPLPIGTIGDTVWCDGLEGTGNGVFDAGEGLPSVTVSLFDDSDCNNVADGVTIATQNTAGDGQYLFSSLPIGIPGSPVCYVVRVDASDPDLGACDSPITPEEFQPDLDSDNPDSPTNDFGFEEPLGTGSIGDTVWCDGLEGTGNGVFDAGEGLPSVTVSLFDDSDCNNVADGVAIATQNTAGDGQYLFSSLPIGIPGSPVCYVVRVDASDPDLGACDSPITPEEFQPDLDSDDPDSPTNDFGFEEPLGTGSIGDTVWCDGLEGTGNGVFDGGEGLPDVTVSLFEDADCNDRPKGPPIATQETVADGQYLFSDLPIGPPGSPVCYVVQVDAADKDLGTCDSPITPLVFVPDLDRDNPDSLVNDFGFEEPLGTGSIGDTVWCDGFVGTGNGVFDAGEGQPDITVDLFEDPDCDDVANGSAIATQVTVGDGQYLFTGLPIGPPGSPVCYVVAVDAKDKDLGSCDSPITPLVFEPDLDSDNPDSLVNDFGFEEPLGTGSIGDTVWCDGLTGTGNGAFDPGEGVAGVPVNLFEDTDCNSRPDGSAIATQSTAGDGQYLFTDLPIGPPGNPVCYVVTVDPRAGSLGTCDDPITPLVFDPDLDSDVPDSLTNDFGFEEPCVDDDGDGLCNESCGEDRDGDGVPDCLDFDPQGYLYCEDTGEILPGGNVSVIGPGAVDLIEDGSAGRYVFFTDGTPGEYSLIVTPPAEFPLSRDCLDMGPLDPTGSSDPLMLGAGEYDSSGFLVSSLCRDNPYHLTFDLEPGDPVIINNNIPLQSCGVPPVEIPTLGEWGRLALVLLLALGGATSLRRRHKALL